MLFECFEINHCDRRAIDGEVSSDFLQKARFARPSSPEDDVVPLAFGSRKHSGCWFDKMPNTLAARPNRLIYELAQLFYSGSIQNMILGQISLVRSSYARDNLNENDC